MIKTFTFALVHMTVAFTVVYLMTGNWLAGGAVALVEPACNTIAYAMHEKAWARWGRRAIGRDDDAKPGMAASPLGAHG
ncbi:DUF2061 domain-containing protein [Algiphilus sp.]|uniref:DUF2061 domain-containing protein n=1 Tax=Algiphilus sp. TaxID=1872431 RepID=UPI003B52E4CD